MLKLDGSRKMTGAFDLDDNEIKWTGTPDLVFEFPTPYVMQLMYESARTTFGEFRCGTFRSSIWRASALTSDLITYGNACSNYNFTSINIFRLKNTFMIHNSFVPPSFSYLVIFSDTSYLIREI